MPLSLSRIASSARAPPLPKKRPKPGRLNRSSAPRRNCQNPSLTLGAHSDTGGNDKANIDASESRGLAVAAWLIERGIAEERISVIAFGEQNPIEPNALPDGSTNEAGRAANRRVEMVVDAVVSAQSDEMTSEVGDQS